MPDPSVGPICIALVTPPGAIRAGLQAMLAEDLALRVVHVAAGLIPLSDLPANTDLIVLTPGAARATQAAAWDTLFTALPGVALLFLLPEEPAPLPANEVLSGRVWGALPLGIESETLQAAVHALYQGLLVSLPGLPLPFIPRQENGDGEAYEALTPRETEVLQQMTLGLTNKQIALRLGISEHTVKYHISAVYGKLKAMNRAEAVSKGARLGMIEI